MSDTTFLDEHTLQAERQFFHLDDIKALWDDVGDRRRRGMALVKESGLNVVLTVAHGGQVLDEQQPRGAATIHVLQGKVRVQVDGEETECGPGDLVALDAHVARTVEILEDSAFLTTVSLATNS